MIYDIILVAIFLIMIVIYVYRGAMRSLMGIISEIIAYAMAIALGKLLAVQAYKAIFLPAIDKAVNEAIANLGTDAASQLTDNLPSWMAGILNLSGADLNNLLQQGLSGAGDMATSAVSSAVEPIAVGLLTFFITIILFLLLSIFLRIVIVNPLLRLVRGASLVRKVDGLLGGILGFVAAFLLVSMLAYLLKLLLPNISSQSGWLNESTIYNSFIFYHFYSGNIFTAISSWIGI